MVYNQREYQKYRIEQMLDSESIVENSISYDDQQILYSSDRSGVYNVYTLPTTGGSPTQLTTSTSDAVFAISYFPNDKRFLYLSDKGGNEIFHIYVAHEDGSVVDLTPSENERAEFYGWHHDLKRFFFGSNKRDPKFMDIYEMSIEQYASRLVFENNSGYNFGAISKDGRYIALQKVNNDNDSDIFIYDCESSNLTHRTPHKGDVYHFPKAFGKNSNELFYLTDERTEFLHLNKMDLETNESEVVIAEEWDIIDMFFSYAHRFLVYKVNRDAKSEVKLIDTITNETVTISHLPDGQVDSVSVSRSGKLVSFLINTSTSPNNIYVYHMDTKELTKLTDTLSPSVNELDLVEAEIVRYPSFDGLMIPAVMYTPHLKEGERAPALVWVHGGPGGQSTVHYHPLIQYLVNHGYAVMAVNNRGSAGYGKTFYKAANLKHGEIDLADCIEAKSYLKTLDAVDGDRIGIIGGSYGGYMVLAALAFQPDSFNVGVDIFGVSNWERTLKSVPSWWESIREALYKKIGDPYKNTDYIRSISPLFHADHIKKPMIVLQGANDPRVLQVESDEIVAALKKNNIPVEYIVFPDEGHGFTKKENQIIGHQAILHFLDHYLAKVN